MMPQMSPHTTMISCKIETIRLEGTVTKVILSSSTSTLSDTVIETSSKCLIPQACNLEKFSILKYQWTDVTTQKLLIFSGGRCVRPGTD